MGRLSVTPFYSARPATAMVRRFIALPTFLVGTVILALDWWARWDFLEQKAKDHPWLRPVVDLLSQEHIAAIIQFLSQPGIGVVIMLAGFALFGLDWLRREPTPSQPPSRPAPEARSAFTVRFDRTREQYGQSVTRERDKYLLGVRNRLEDRTVRDVTVYVDIVEPAGARGKHRIASGFPLHPSEERLLDLLAYPGDDPTLIRIGGQSVGLHVDAIDTAAPLDEGRDIAIRYVAKVTIVGLDVASLEQPCTFWLARDKLTLVSEARQSLPTVTPAPSPTPGAIVRDEIHRGGIRRLGELLEEGENLHRRLDLQGVAAKWKKYKQLRPDVQRWNDDLVLSIPDTHAADTWVAQAPPSSSTDIGPYVRERLVLIRRLRAQLDKEAPEFLPPACERPVGMADYYKWWKVPVRARDIDIRDCRVSIVVDAIEWPAVWDDVGAGPQERTTLERRKPPRLVPVVIRSEILTSVPENLPAGVARLTERQFYIGDTDRHVDIGPGTCNVRLRVSSGESEWWSPSYKLTVPHHAGNTGFDLELIER